MIFNQTQNRVAHPFQSHRKDWVIRAIREPLSFDIPKDVPGIVVQKKIVISTEATDSLTVRCAVERPPHFAFAVVLALAIVLLLIILRPPKLSSFAEGGGSASAVAFALAVACFFYPTTTANPVFKQTLTKSNKTHSQPIP
jgi:hypothetical protein